MVLDFSRSFSWAIFYEPKKVKKIEFIFAKNYQLDKKRNYKPEIAPSHFNLHL